MGVYDSFNQPDRLIFGSGYYSLSNVTSINPGMIYIFDLTASNEMQKYAPFNNIIIYNNSNSDIWIYLNQSENNKIFVKSNSLINLTPKDTVGVYSIKVLNAGTNVIDTNMIIVTARREGISVDTLPLLITERLKKGFRL
jgi:hypothetical protein